MAREELTPRHRLRQLEPSLFFKGHTTSLLASVTEKELVSELRGGMVHIRRGAGSLLLVGKNKSGNEGKETTKENKEKTQRGPFRTQVQMARAEGEERKRKSD